MEHEIYLDNAATMPPHPEVVETVARAMTDCYGNASSTHGPGKQARALLAESRKTVAKALGVGAGEVYFTSGGTESNNLAIVGAAKAAKAADAQRIELITSSLEHPSVTKTVRGLKREGWTAAYLDAVHGNLDLSGLRVALSERTALVTVVSVQNELGYLFPLAEVCDLRDALAPQALVHTDAVQAFGKIDVKPRKLGVDLASISAHKIGGPKGIGALYVKKGTPLFTTAFGGGQERGLRSGTEAVPLIAGFAKAVEITMASRKKHEQRLWDMKREIATYIRANWENAVINSRADGSPFLMSLSILGLNNTRALAYLSERGIYVSKASACSSNHLTVPKGTWREKHPLALELAGIPKGRTKDTLRLSFSQYTKEEDVWALIHALEDYRREQESK